MKASPLLPLLPALGLLLTGSCADNCSDEPVERLVAQLIDDPTEWVDEDGQLLFPCEQMCLGEGLTGCELGLLRSVPDLAPGGAGGEGSRIALEVLCYYEPADPCE